MPVEQPEDLAAMFDVDAFAEAATYTPPGGGAGVAVAAIVSRESAIAELPGSARFAAAATIAKVRAAQLASPARGGTLALASGNFKIARVDQDSTAAIWTLVLEKQA